MVNSSPPEEGAIGATLEIQRSQQMEAFEQQFVQQQNRVDQRFAAARPRFSKFLKNTHTIIPDLIILVLLYQNDRQSNFFACIFIDFLFFFCVPKLLAS